MLLKQHCPEYDFFEAQPYARNAIKPGFFSPKWNDRIHKRGMGFEKVCYMALLTLNCNGLFLLCLLKNVLVTAHQPSAWNP
jgi:hypothetical protein